MRQPKICVVIPTIRPEQYRLFSSAWEELFKRHQVTLITVWDGETPHVDVWDYGTNSSLIGNVLDYDDTLYTTYKNLIYRYTDACRNLGFITAAHLQPDYILTLDDDVVPLIHGHQPTLYNKPQPIFDPIQSHLNVLQKRVPLGWMNTAHDSDPYLRGVPYSNRNEAPVMLSHGVWVGTPDFDGETQLGLENTTGVPYSLDYYVGPIPRNVHFPCCGMSLMVLREALPYLYFAPMGKDTGIEGLNRFADIWMGCFLKQEFDKLGWACYTGGSTILHTRASDAKKNFEQEKLGREWNENIVDWVRGNMAGPVQAHEYFRVYEEKREGFRKLIESIFLKNKTSAGMVD